MPELTKFQRLIRLADINFLTKGLDRLTEEAREFDLRSRLSPVNRKRLDRLEGHLRDLIKTGRDVQKQVDANMTRFTALVRTQDASRAVKKPNGKVPTRKRKSTRKTAPH